VVTTHFNTSGSAEAVVVGPSGAITLAGFVCFCTHDEALVGSALVRYTPAGALDSTFGSGGVVTRFSLPGGSFNDLALDPSGRVVVAGGSDGGFFLARYTSAGALDSTFGSGGEVTTRVGSGTNEAANALALDPAGRIIAAGFTYACGRFTCSDDFALARVNPDGSLDPGFGTGGAVTTDFGPGEVDRARDVALAPAGDIVAAGTSGDAFGLARYTPSGALDPTFGAGGMVTTTFKPNTWISDVKIKSKKHTASFRFAAGSPNSGFQCALRSKKHPKARFKRCRSRFGQLTYAHLERGRYTFAVRAIFPGGPDPTPAKWRFRIR
jgi:uncharacterized delta-60 repeat protein